jgi:hypothetical protein
MDYTDAFEKILLDWLKSENENATYCAALLNKYVQEQLNPKPHNPDDFCKCVDSINVGGTCHRCSKGILF